MSAGSNQRRVKEIDEVLEIKRKGHDNFPISQIECLSRPEDV